MEVMQVGLGERRSMVSCFVQSICSILLDFLKMRQKWGPPNLPALH